MFGAGQNLYHCGMRQMDERHLANQVDLMTWSNRLDLVAISNFKGEVQIHRLHWQKVWNLLPPRENVLVSALAWRPDGKIGAVVYEIQPGCCWANISLAAPPIPPCNFFVYQALAIGYNSGSVYIVDIEDKEVLDKYDLELEQTDNLEDTKHHGITCITWAVREGTLESATEYNIYDDTSIFLQKPPSLSSGFKNQSAEDNVKDFKEIQEFSQLNLLLVGYGTGNIHMSIFGRYSYGTIHLAQVAKDECGEYNVLDICVSEDFSMLQVVYGDRVTNNLFVSVINTSVLSAFAEEMFVVANRHGQVSQLLLYLDQTMTSITEAWEHILLEMDTKMSYYAASVPEGAVSADLLDLLMLGVPSDELEVFLLQDLTAKGLKKFGSSVELSYSTIQKLVLKQLNIVGQSLTYYLSELRGLTRVPDRYKILGIDEGTVTEAIRACCAFLNKCLELQQVIDASMRNYKAFFRWLFVVIVRLLDEQTPSEIVKITQQELSHIAEFLYNFDCVQLETSPKTPEKPVKFNLERLGQYLQDQDLTILPDDEDNPWHKFLQDNACLLKESDTIFSMAEFRKFSLVQQQKFLKNAVIKVFDFNAKDIGKYFSVLFNIKCYEDRTNQSPIDKLRVSQIFNASRNRFTMAFMFNDNNFNGMHLMALDIMEKACHATATKYYFSSNLVQKESNDEVQITLMDLEFYSPEYLSIVASHPHNNESSTFIQVPLKIAIDNSTEFNVKSKSWVFTDKIEKKDMTPLLDQGVFKVFDKMDGYRIAVSGGRKVGVVLSKSLRKVRVFEMEVDGEDEDDETFDTTPQSNKTHRSEDQVTPGNQNTTTEDIF